MVESRDSKNKIVAKEGDALVRLTDQELLAVVGGLGGTGKVCW